MGKNGNRINDKRKIKLDEVLSKDYIPFLSGRPERTKVIKDEDISNLKIELNTSTDLRSFLERV